MFFLQILCLQYLFFWYLYIAVIVLNVVQIIMDFEASILGGKFAWEVNRNKRFDFIENAKCLNEID